MTRFYVGCALTSALFVAAGAWGLVQAATSSATLTVDPAGLTLPVGRWRQETRTVRWADVRGVVEQTIDGQTFLRVRLEAGEVTVAAIMLPTKRDDEEVRRLIVEAVAARDPTRAVPPGPSRVGAG